LVCSEIDPGLEEAITTVLWATPRLSADVQELKEVRVGVFLKCRNTQLSCVPYSNDRCSVGYIIAL